MIASRSADPTPLPGQRVPRCPFEVPVRVTAMRAGSPNPIPGRSMNLSEGGLAAVLAAEVNPGDSVAVEFLLPQTGVGLYAKARVRYRARERCGLEFQGLSLEQRAMIRRWTHRKLAGLPIARVPAPLQPAVVAEEKNVSSRLKWPSWLNQRVLIGVAAVLAIFVLAGWWKWEKSWDAIEPPPPASSAADLQRLSVSSQTMEGLLLYKVQPRYPEDARGDVGAVSLDVVVGADGTVIDLHSTSGSPALARAAMDAVRQWRFQPYTIQDRPVEVEFPVSVDFPAP